MDEINTSIAMLAVSTFIMGLAIGVVLTKLVDMMNVVPAAKKESK
ncbi:MAG: hypothetical protein PHG85_01800 [Candidatus Altiarchaeota archaeon]|nr:hypothetical protein [Candidatus Altiarchaeota archaeon]